MAESTKEKGQRLYQTGNVAKIAHERYEVKGSSGKYLVERRGTFFVCPCPARKGACSHVEGVYVAIDAEMRATAAAAPTSEVEATDKWLDEMTAGFVDLDEADRPLGATELQTTLF